MILEFLFPWFFKNNRKNNNIFLSPALKNGETLNEWQQNKLNSGICPDCCHAKGMICGPEGSVMINTACENCGAEFNWSPIYSHRNSNFGKPDIERLKNCFAIELPDNKE